MLKANDITGTELYNLLLYAKTEYAYDIDATSEFAIPNGELARLTIGATGLYIVDPVIPNLDAVARQLGTTATGTNVHYYALYSKKVQEWQMRHNVSGLSTYQFDGNYYNLPIPLVWLLTNDLVLLQEDKQELYENYICRRQWYNQDDKLPWLPETVCMTVTVADFIVLQAFETAVTLSLFSESARHSPHILYNYINEPDRNNSSPSRLY